MTVSVSGLKNWLAYGSEGLSTCKLKSHKIKSSPEVIDRFSSSVVNSDRNKEVVNLNV